MTDGALIFDFDGVIVDTELNLFRTWQRLFAGYGQTLNLGCYRRIIARPDAPQTLARIATGGEGHGWEAIWLRVRHEHRHTADTLPSLPGVRDLIQAAQYRGIRMAVASGSTSSWVQHHLERLGLRGSFTAVVGRDMVRANKPCPDLYLAAIAGLRAMAQGSLAIEDSPHGLRAAVAAGLRCIAVPGPVFAGGDFSGCQSLHRSLADLDIETLWQRLRRGR